MYFFSKPAQNPVFPAFPDYFAGNNPAHPPVPALLPSDINTDQSSTPRGLFAFSQFEYITVFIHSFS
jgi:hypothetical protein